MPNLRSLRDADAFTAVMREAQEALKHRQENTKEEKAYQQELKVWLAAGADAYNKVGGLLAKYDEVEAQAVMTRHNKAKPKRRKGQRRTIMPRHAVIESVLIAELALIALSSAAVKSAATRRAVIDRVVAELVSQAAPA